MSLSRAFSCLLLLPSVLILIQAQEVTERAANSSTTIKTTVQRVLVDVVVTNDKGDPVKGLHEKDFKVFEDGKPQKIATFEEHHGAALSEIRLPPMPPHVYTNFPLMKSADAVNVLLLDALNTRTADQSYVHWQMVKFLKTIPPETRVAVFTLSSRLRMIQPVTTDPSELLEAMRSTQALQHQSGVLTSEEEQEEMHHLIGFLLANQSSPYSAPPDLARSEVDSVNALKEFLTEAATLQTGTRIDITLQAFQELTRYLENIPGRKNVIWFSGSFPTTIFPSGDLANPFVGLADFQSQIRKTADLLSASRVALYPVEAGGLVTDSAFQVNGEEIGTTRPSQNDQDLATQLRGESLDRDMNYATMDELAKVTGGKAYYNTNGLGDVLNRVIRNGTHYYSLTYAPSDSVMNGRYRHIRVELRKSKEKVTLAYRRGYYADNLAATLAATKPNADPLLPLVGRNMPDYSQILYKVLVQPVTPQPPADAPHIGSNPNLKGPVTRYGADFAIAIGDLKLDVAADGVRHGNIEIALAAYDREGTLLNMFKTAGEVVLKPNEYAALQQGGGLQVQEKIDVPAGYVYLRTGIYDVKSGAAGTLGIPLAESNDRAAK